MVVPPEEVRCSCSSRAIVCSSNNCSFLSLPSREEEHVSYRSCWTTPDFHSRLHASRVLPSWFRLYRRRRRRQRKHILSAHIMRNWLTDSIYFCLSFAYARTSGTFTPGIDTHSIHPCLAPLSSWMSRRIGNSRSSSRSGPRSLSDYAGRFVSTPKAKWYFWSCINRSVCRHVQHA